MCMGLSFGGVASSDENHCRVDADLGDATRNDE